MAYTITTILFLMGLGFSLAAPIGPVNFEMLKQTLTKRSGIIFGILTGLGAMTGDFIIASSVLFIGSQYLNSLISDVLIFSILVSLNVVILTYIGIGAFRINIDELDQELREETDQEETSFVGHSNLYLPFKQLITGFVLVTTSPWSYLWWASFGPYIIGLDIPIGTWLERLVVTIYFLFGIFVWIILYCSSLSITQKFASAKVLGYITKASAVLIFGFAIKIVYDAICRFTKLSWCENVVSLDFRIISIFIFVFLTGLFVIYLIRRVIIPWINNNLLS